MKGLNEEDRANLAIEISESLTATLEWMKLVEKFWKKQAEKEVKDERTKTLEWMKLVEKFWKEQAEKEVKDERTK